MNGEEKATRDEVKNLIEQLRELIATVDLEDEDDEKRISVYDISLTSSVCVFSFFGWLAKSIFLKIVIYNIYIVIIIKSSVSQVLPTWNFKEKKIIQNK